MNLIRTSFLELEEKQAVLKLWNQEYPKNLRYSTVEEFNNYLTGLENLRHVLVKDDRHTILGWYSDFKRENEVWFAMILDTSIQGKGIGTRLIKKAKKTHEILNAWVIDHSDYRKNDDSIYNSPLKFYLKNDFEIIKETRLKLPKISAVKITWKRD